MFNLSSILIFVFSIIVAKPLEIQPNSPSNLIECANKLVGSYLTQNQIIDPIVMTHPALKLAYPIMINNASPKIRKVDVYVLRLAPANVEPWFKKFERQQHFNPRALYVLDLHTLPDSILPIFVKYYVYKVLAIDHRLDVHDFSPYGFENVNEKALAWRKIGRCSDDLNVSWQDKLPRQWRNTTLHLLAKMLLPFTHHVENRYSGFEMNILQVAQQKLGFKFNVTKQTDLLWGEKEKDGSYYSGLGSLQRREYDGTVGAYSNMRDFSLDFDMTYVYISKQVVWVTPAAEVMGYATRFLYILPWDAWLYFFATSFISVLVFKAMNIEVETAWNFMFKVWLGGSTKLLRSSSSYRTLLIFWIYFCLIMSTLFKNEMMYMFTSVKYYKEIDTKDDLFASDADISVVSFVRNYCQVHDDLRFRRFISRAKINENVSKSMELVASSGHISASYKIVAEFAIANQYLDQNGYPTIHIVKEKLLEIYTSLSFVKGYPMYGQINDLIFKLLDNGFIHYRIGVYTEYINGLKYKSKKLRDHYKLGMLELLFSFRLWGYGIVLSTITFFVELLYYRFVNGRDNIR